jgi:hypothetical protein
MIGFLRYTIPLCIPLPRCYASLNHYIMPIERDDGFLIILSPLCILLSHYNASLHRYITSWVFEYTSHIMYTTLTLLSLITTLYNFLDWSYNS